MPLYVVFIDFKKAFDSVELPAIWEALERFGIDAGNIELIKMIYANGSSSVHVGSSSVPINVQKGVRQGDTLSPLLFILVLQLALNQVNWNTGININGSILGHLDFADDIALLSQTLEGVQSLVNQVAEECRFVGLHINADKTKWMSNVPDQNETFLLNDEEVEKVTEFIYLGQLVKWPSRPDIVHAARQRKWNYLQKLMSLPDYRWNRKLTEWTPNLKRPVGRPPTKWMDDFTKFTNKKPIEMLSLCLTNFWCCNMSPFVLRDR
uniref:Reverse transcriptase domain-containing protein n=1 Tax=Panagrolaimus sp. ES5 TaxID=591445 RepID=A0AC34FXB8_9BILA